MMWGIPDKGAGLELFKFGLSLLLLVATWTLGQLLVLRWEEKKRVREISRDMRRQFHELYGQFKSNVRLWKARGKPTDPHDCPELLEKAVLAEGLVEGLLSDLAALKKLSDDECTALGLFRQGYQTMRQALTNKRPNSVPADYDSAPYHLFNDLTTTVSRLVVVIRDEPSPEEARRSFDGIIDVRTDEWDKAVKLVKEKRPWNELIEEITKARKENLEHSTKEIPTFQVGKAFPEGDDKRVSLVRFLLASQSLAAIGRLLGIVPETPAFTESKRYLMLLSLGAAHEAANAFWGAYTHGVFADLQSLGWKEMDKRLARLVKECDRKNPDSLQCKLVTHGRNKFSFHWDMEEIQECLAQLSSANLPAWSGGDDESSLNTAIPIAGVVTQKGLEIKAGSREQLHELMSKVGKFQGDLFHVAHVAYTTAIRKNLAEEKRSGA